jgi:ribulose kinase
MFAGVVGGLYPSLAESMKAMQSGWEREYRPRPEFARRYAPLYERYCALARFIESDTMRAGETP